MDDLRIEYRDSESLRADKRNARTHSKKQIRQIADSIREFGFTCPVLIDGQDIVIAGHGRIQAAKFIGMSKVPTILLDHLSADQKRAYVIADNRLAELAGWDEELLAIEFQISYHAYIAKVAGRFDSNYTEIWSRLCSN